MKKTSFYLIQAITNAGFIEKTIEANTSRAAKIEFFKTVITEDIQIEALKIKRIGDKTKQHRLQFNS